MPDPHLLILGEFQRTFDERYRVSIPTELVTALGGEDLHCVLAKEGPGCLSLWNAAQWETRLKAGVDLVEAKLQAGKLEGRWQQVQLLGRLLSTRHRAVQLGARGRLIVPEGFREFLHAEPGSDVMIVGAAVCVEIWNLKAWLEHLESRMPKFRRLLDRLSS